MHVMEELAAERMPEIYKERFQSTRSRLRHQPCETSTIKISVPQSMMNSKRMMLVTVHTSFTDKHSDDEIDGALAQCWPGTFSAP